MGRIKMRQEAGGEFMRQEGAGKGGERYRDTEVDGHVSEFEDPLTGEGSEFSGFAKAGSWRSGCPGWAEASAATVQRLGVDGAVHDDGRERVIAGLGGGKPSQNLEEVCAFA